MTVLAPLFRRLVEGADVRFKPTEQRFWEKVDVCDDDECWEWTAAKARMGYGNFALRHGVLIPAHRLSWILAHGMIPEGLWVLHRCDNPPCVNPAHLFVGTRQDNLDDMVAKRRHWAHKGESITKGERNGRAKLTDAQVREIRDRYAAGGVSQPQLGREFGVTHAIIGNVVRRESWVHV